MQQIANIFIAIVAVLHLYFLLLEMFMWTKPNGRKAFGTTQQFAEETKVLAANQGLYNGFLAAGLVWGLLQNDWHTSFHIKIFFLTCVIIAGIYGAYSTKKIKLFYIQGLPALVALVLLHFK
jgi:putative membrane protein